ncbi:MAG: hypothetical protein CME63_13020 [Halobacteriovoraceae bacterium]|nr:hypothetical protein [Halobacteriovoraceae bacterium]|tara:strand:+ start:1330 stop:2301 length:972 start_codon:yes stop_codon:yes gene_type:complete
MEVIKFYTNFTFEEELLNGFRKGIYNKKNYFFEFLFLWIEGDDKILWTPKGYDKQYLDQIRRLTGSVPHISEKLKKEDRLELWWGDSQKRNEVEINDKLTSFRARNELGFGLENSCIISQQEELAQYSEFPEKHYLFKSRFGFSGRGMSSDPIKAKNFNLPLLVEPLLSVVDNYGITFFNENDYFVIKNYSDHLGQFKGGEFVDFQDRVILEKMKKIFEWYKFNFNVARLQIDFFSYLKEGELMWNYLSEVNHRKTMGYILNQLKEKFGDRYAYLKIGAVDTTSLKVSKINKIELSPINHPMKVTYLGSDHPNIRERYLQNLV